MNKSFTYLPTMKSCEIKTNVWPARLKRHNAPVHCFASQLSSGRGFLFKIFQPKEAMRLFSAVRSGLNGVRTSPIKTNAAANFRPQGITNKVRCLSNTLPLRDDESLPIWPREHFLFVTN